MNISKCPICGSTNIEVLSEHEFMLYRIKCDRCVDYFISFDALTYKDSKGLSEADFNGISNVVYDYNQDNVKVFIINDHNNSHDKLKERTGCDLFLTLKEIKEKVFKNEKEAG